MSLFYVYRLFRGGSPASSVNVRARSRAWTRQRRLNGERQRSRPNSKGENNITEQSTTNSQS